MKYFKENNAKDKIKLIEDDRVISIKKNSSDGVRIQEGCDNYFCVYCTHAEAIELFQEAIDWLKGESS